jgi:hypothetical protein
MFRPPPAPVRYWPCGAVRKPYPPPRDPTGAELAEAFQDEIKRLRIAKLEDKA